MPKQNTDTRNEILRCALQLFLQKGYRDVSYQDLVQKSGLSKGAIYHYFASKEELLVGTFQFLAEASGQWYHNHPENGITDKESFKKVFSAIKVEQIASFKKLLDIEELKPNKLLFFIEALNENEQLKTLAAAMMMREMNFLESCVAALQKGSGFAPGKNTTTLAKALYWMLEGAEMQIFFWDNLERTDNILKLYCDTIDEFFSLL